MMNNNTDNNLVISSTNSLPMEEDKTITDNNQQQMEEEIEKDNLLDDNDSPNSAEDSYSSSFIKFISMFFTYSFVSDVMKAGYKKGDKEGLNHNDIPKLPFNDQAENHYPEFEHVYKQVFEKERKTTTNKTLLFLKVIHRLYSWDLYLPVLWRLLAVIFSCISPFFLYLLLEGIALPIVGSDENNTNNNNAINNSSLLSSSSLLLSTTSGLGDNINTLMNFTGMNYYSIYSLYSRTSNIPNILFTSTASSLLSTTLNNNTSSFTNQTSSTFSWFVENLPLNQWYFQIILTLIIFFSQLAGSLVLQRYYFLNVKTWLRMRNVLQVAVFQKLLRITPSERSKFDSGELTNIYTTDTNRFSVLIIEIHELWISPLIVTLVIIYTILFFGWSAMIGNFIILLLGPILSVTAKKLSSIEALISKTKDKRTKAMNELLNGIRIIKFFVFEDKMKEKVLKEREEEYNLLRKAALLKILQRFLSILLVAIGSSITFILYYLFGGQLTVANILTGLFLYDMIREPIINFPVQFSVNISGYVSAKRLAKLLFAEEMNYLPHDPFNKLKLYSSSNNKNRIIANNKVNNKNTDENEIVMTDKELMDQEEINQTIHLVQHHSNRNEEDFVEDLSLLIDQQEQQQENINKQTKQQQENNEQQEEKEEPLDDHVAIQFKNASFKYNENDTNNILKDINLTIEKGKLYCIIGKVGCGKTSLFSSIYGNTILTKGSLKINNSCSIALCDENPWLINGTIRDNIIFNNINTNENYNNNTFIDKEKYKTILKICQLEKDLNEFHNYDKSEVGFGGINLSGGQKHRLSLARTCYSNANILLLDSCLNAVDAYTSNRIFNDCILGYLKGKTRILITHSLQLLEFADVVIVMEDGKIILQGPLNEIKDKYDFSKLISESKKEQEEEEQLEQQQQLKEEEEEEEKNSERDNKKKERNEQKGKIISIEDKTSGSIKLSIIFHYMKEFGIPLLLICLLLVLVCTTLNFGIKFLISLMDSSSIDNTQQQTTTIIDNDNNNNIFSFDFYLYTFVILSFIEAILVSLRDFSFAFATLRSSNNLHLKMFERILRAPISFFDQNPIGRILNRFTQDQYTLDYEMLFTVGFLFARFLQVIFTLISTAIITPFILIIVPFIAIIFYFIQLYYRRTSREIRRLESLSKSPQMSLFSSYLSGLNTIKASLLNESLNYENFKRINFFTKHSYIRYGINRWLAIRIQFIAQIIIVFTCIFVILSKQITLTSNSLLTLAITFSLRLTELFTFIVRILVDFESSMTSVERILYYSNEIEQEAPTHLNTEFENNELKEWPKYGNLIIKNLTVKYRNDLDPILKNINLTIHHGEKIAIVGRTGSGKSSLLLTLFRFIEPLNNHSILIDDIDIQSIGLNKLRRALTIIPQQPILFSNTIRYNIDPFNEFEDFEIWNALERVHLKEKIKEMKDQLSEQVLEDGKNFSIGECQLLTLCRCILRKSKIIIFDEATAYVDSKSDELVQRTIREEFKDSTIIMVAHRLDTIIDADRIVVLDSGELVEIGKPMELLKNENGYFYKLVNETGKNYSLYLRNMCKEIHEEI
ncbi:hypothetical protein ABK040_012494 [Willaertia magna]